MSDFKGFYFPTKVILVDDNPSFLDNLGLKLSDNHLVETYSDPFEALEVIEQNVQNSVFGMLSDVMMEVNDEEDDSNHYTIDFNQLHALANKAYAEHPISVVIVDYSMPGLNGIEFCKRLSHIPALKIMLTGNTDFKLAVDAFNGGVIDKFLIKDTDHMLREITDSIGVCQDKFFIKSSNSLLNCLSASKNTWIHSKEHMEHFKKITEELSIVEYYLLNATGTYLLLSKNGRRYYFTAFDDNQLEDYLDIAENTKADPVLLKKIRDKTHAPILINDEDYKIPASDWDCLLQSIERKGAGYYCVIPERLHPFSFIDKG